MTKHKLKSLALGVAAAALMHATDAAAACSSLINVAVSPSIANTASNVVAAFYNYYPSASYCVGLVVYADANIASDIVSGGSTGPYDLFLSDSAVYPYDLAFFYSSLVSGQPFPFATDTLDLYSSANTPVNISGGLPTTGIQPFKYPDPSTLDPWGLAAIQVLYSKWPYIQALENGIGTTDPNTVAVYADVEFSGVAYGFTAKSQVCNNYGGGQVYEVGSYHYEYEFGRDYFTPIEWFGVAIARGQTAAQETELTDFINFLTGVGTTAGTAALQQTCLQIPPQP